MIPCRHCGRTFQPSVAERHIPICANVRNRPRPPPSPRTLRLTDSGEPSPPRSALKSRPSPHESSYSQQELRTLDPRRSSSCSRIPSVPGTPKRGTPRSPIPGGTGTQAARSLRRGECASAGKLPRAPRHDSVQNDRTVRPPRPEDYSDTDTRDSTLLTPSTGGSVERVGLRRSAMLYRLLSKVPRSALELELGDAGISHESLDDEGLIEALLVELT